MAKPAVVDYLFLVEHEDRELSSVKAIAEGLKTLGKTSCVLSLEFFGYMMHSINANNIVVPYSISSESWPLKYVKRIYPHAQVYSLNWEQLLSDANKAFKKPRDSYIKCNIKHLAWSEDYKRFLVDSGVVQDNVRVLGNPLSQLLQEFVEDSHEVKRSLFSEFNLNPNKETIFFPMNYGWAFFTDEVILKKIAQGYDAEVAYEYRNYSRKCISKFCFFIKDVVSSGDYNVVIRPHPSISEEQYKEVFNKNCPGVIESALLTKKYTIKEWIAASDIIASSWSTSVWDAASIGKKVFLYTPYERPLWLNTWWNNIVPNLSSISELDLIQTEYAKTGENTAKNIIPSIVRWLDEFDQSDCKIKSRVTHKYIGYLDRYFIRCLLRVFSMKFFKGLFVPKGMQRDYFKPFYTE